MRRISLELAELVPIVEVATTTLDDGAQPNEPVFGFISQIPFSFSNTAIPSEPNFACNAKFGSKVPIPKPVDVTASIGVDVAESVDVAIDSRDATRTSKAFHAFTKYGAKP